MKSLYVEAHSEWQDTALGRDFSAVGKNLTCDICIVGAGISGLSAAYQLIKAGKKVVVIDREARLGLHETGLSSAHLSNAFDDRYYTLEKLHGVDGSRIAAESHTVAIDLIEEISKLENIDCDFKRVDGYLFLKPGDTTETLKKEFAAARRAGISVDLMSRAPTQMLDTGPCLRFPQQAQFHPLKYLDGLAKAIVRSGGQIFTESPASNIIYGPPHKIITDQNYEIICEHLIVATNSPVNDIFRMHTKLAAYRSYVIGVRIPRGQMAPILLWDTGDAYHYVRLLQKPEDDFDILLVGGEDHRVGQESRPALRYENLKNWVRENFRIEPEVVDQWSGQIIETVDTLAFIGRNPGPNKNVFIITGDSGQGLTHATLGSLILRDLILDRPNSWSALYDPSRIPLRGFGNYVRENLQSVSPYADWVAPGDVKKAEEIPAGEGAVMRHGLKKVACFKDTFGNMHVFSAVCPHLGAVVRWNSSEKTWDCPCHGSRFHRYGEVLNGPAPHGLRPLQETGEEAQLPPSP